MGKRFWLCVTMAVLLLGHLAYDAAQLYQQALRQQAGAYALPTQRLSERVVLVVLDSWAIRIMEDATLMPLLHKRQQSGASGVLWAPRQTGTVNGILTLSTGVSPSGLSAVGLLASSAYTGWTIFDDIVARGENVSFHGGPSWLPLFGERGTGHFRETGHGPNFRQDDMEGLAHGQAALLSGHPPALTVVHITETDVAAHHYGTQRPEYRDVLAHWDRTLNAFIDAVLQRPGTTLILTADHGNDLNGNHGGSDPIYRRAPVMMWGQGIAAGTRIEMNAADMPATMAVLLGTKAPAAAAALPAVDALTMPLVSKARALAAGYFYSFMSPDKAQLHPNLAARARQAYPLPSDDLTFAWLGEAQASEVMGRVRGAFSALEELAVSARNLQWMDWVFVVLTLAMAGVMAWLAKLDGQAGHARPGQVATSGRAWLAWIGALIAIECVFALRLAYAVELRTMLRARAPVFWQVLAGAAVVAALAMAWLVQHRAAAIQVWRAHRPMFVILAYVVTTVVYPVNMAGLMAGTLAAAWLGTRAWPERWRWGAMAAVLAYLLAGAFIWMALGESPQRRYMVGLPMAILIPVALAWLDRRHALGMAASAVRHGPVLGLAVALAMLPFSSVFFNHLSDDPSRWVGSLCSVAVMAVLMRAWRLSPLLWLAWAPTLAFWWWGEARAWGLYAALLAGAGLTGFMYWRERATERVYPSVLLCVVCLLMTMSRPEHAVTLWAVGAVIVAFLRLDRHDTRPMTSLALLVVLLVAARYAVFDLFGYADSPAPVYALKHLDLAVAYLGDDNRSIGGATLMVVLKVWLAGMALMLLPTLSAYWRGRMDVLMTMVTAALLLQLVQVSIRVGLAVNGASHQYDFAAFSLLIHTGILVLGMLAYGVLRRPLGVGALRAWPVRS